MQVNKENSFNAPEGNYRMKLVSCELGHDKNGNERLRIVGDLVSLKSRIYNYQAGVNYMEGSTELLPDLHKILGSDVVYVIGEDGEVLPDGLPLLRGKECDIQLVHIHNRKHVNPYCKVTRIEEAGVLIKYPID